MTELKIFVQNNQLLTDSREVAEMIDKRHDHLVRDIRGYVEIMESTAPNFGVSGGQLEIRPSDFFIESSYTDSTGRTLPCYLLTKKGCDMVANKLTGQKGVLFTAAYVTAFERMQEHIAKGGAPLPDTTRQALAEAKLLNAKARVSSQWMKLSEYVNIPEYKQICAHYASEVLAGTPAIPLPESGEKYLSATEVGELLGVTPQRIGLTSNANGLKTEEYGKWYHDKSPHSAKEVDTFRYNQRGVEQLRVLLNSK